MAGKSEIDIFIANAVRDKRKENEFSQEKLSIELGFSESFVGNIERPGSPEKYNCTHLNIAARILGCSPKDFWPENPI